jgi:hypothetical protein
MKSTPERCYRARHLTGKSSHDTEILNPEFAGDDQLPRVAAAAAPSVVGDKTPYSIVLIVVGGSRAAGVREPMPEKDDT